MSFSYNNTRIAASGTYTIDFVRFTLDDTDATAYEIDDEVITALYNQTSSGDSQTFRNYTTALNAARYLYRKYSKQVTFSSAGTSMNLSDKYKQFYAAVIQELEQLLLQLAGVNAVLYADRPETFCDPSDITQNFLTGWNVG